MHKPLDEHPLGQALNTTDINAITSKQMKQPLKEYIINYYRSILQSRGVSKQQPLGLN
jgi:hypothetical protein